MPTHRLLPSLQSPIFASHNRIFPWHNHIYNLNAPMQEKHWAGVTAEIDRQQAAIWRREAAVWRQRAEAAEAKAAIRDKRPRKAWASELRPVFGRPEGRFWADRFGKFMFCIFLGGPP